MVLVSSLLVHSSIPMNLLSKGQHHGTGATTTPAAALCAYFYGNVMGELWDNDGILGEKCGKIMFSSKNHRNKFGT